MLRFAELALFLSPFAAFFIWRLLAVEGGPSLRVVLLSACCIAALAGVLVWLSRRDVLPPGAPYVPAHLQDGRIVPGHGGPP